MATNSHLPSAAPHRTCRPALLRLTALTAVLVTAVFDVDASAQARSMRAANAAVSTCAGASAARTLASAPSAPPQTRFVGAAAPLAGSYDWPVKPFNRQHPVRAFFDDPRIGRYEHVFHFGIDIAAPDGAAVYAVAPGRVWLAGESVAVVSDGRVFGYWHIRAAVTRGQYVARHQLLGHVMTGWGHVHFAESHSHRYVNPLRPGGLEPYRDLTPPTVVAAGTDRGKPGPLHGRVTLVADAFDTTTPRIAGPWHDEPVTPALVRSRVLKEGVPVIDWHTAADFRTELMPPSAFRRIYSPATRQNHKGEPGLFCFNLMRAFDTTSLEDGSYRLQVEVSDTRGNRSVAFIAFSVANESHR
jgi:hypothetical protein